MMDELDNVPLVDAMEFKRIARVHGYAAAEAVPMNPLPRIGGAMLLRSRPGSRFVRDKSGVVVAKLR